MGDSTFLLRRVRSRCSLTSPRKNLDQKQPARSFVAYLVDARVSWMEIHFTQSNLVTHGLTEKRTHSVVLDPQTRIDVRIGIGDGDEVEWFVVQLLHNLKPYHAEDEDWREVARFDHNPAALNGHDVAKEGLHMDLAFENSEDETETRFPSHTPPPSDLGLTVRYCVNYLRNRHEELTKEYNDDRRTAR